MSISNQHNVFSSYGAVHMQRQLIPSTVLHGQELDLAAQQAAAAMATKDGLQEARQVVATNAENRTHQFDRHSPKGSSFAMGTGDSGRASTQGSSETSPEPARSDAGVLGENVDVYL